MNQNTALIHGQPSFTLATESVHAAITRFGAMLGPVTFFADGHAPIRPYSVAPWATEPLEPEVPLLLAALRGDFMCSAFGDNTERVSGRVIPPHGDTVNGEWSFVQQRANEHGIALRLGIDLLSQGGRCVATTVLFGQHPFIYQRHDFAGMSGPINPGHHAMLRCPAAAGSAVLSFSPHVLACSSPPRAALSATQSRSRLLPGAFAADVTSMACVDGTTTDITTFPGHEGVDDVLMVCADPARELAWSAATFRSEGYAWLSLRNSAHLPSTLVWLSNGGRIEPPWNGRHKGVLALEDIMGYFASGLAESARDNTLTARGIATCLRVVPGEVVRIPYIQGVVRIPAHFDRVAAVEPVASGELLVRAANGAEVRVACRWEFLGDGRIPGLCDD